MKGFFIKTHNIEIRFVTGPENRLFIGVCVQFSACKFLQAGAVKELIISF